MRISVIGNLTVMVVWWCVCDIVVVFMLSCCVHVVWVVVGCCVVCDLASSGGL